MKKLSLFIISALLLFTVSAQVQVSENFSDYPLGGKIAEEAQAIDRWYWNTWDYDSVGKSQDGEIAELIAGNKCGKFIFGNNQTLKIGEGWSVNYSSLSFKIFVPAGKDASLNLYSSWNQWDPDQNELALQLAFATDLSNTPVYTPGVGKIYGGATGYTTFNFAHDTWLRVRIFFNFESDICKIFLNDNLIHSYQFSLGIDGQGCDKYVEILNILPSTSEELSAFYMDDIVYEIVDAAPNISVSPSSISEQISSGSTSSITKPITLTNSGDGSSEYNTWVKYDFDPIPGTQNFTFSHLVGDPTYAYGPPEEFQVELGVRFSGKQLCDKIGTYVTKISYFLPAPAVVPSFTFRIYAPNTTLETGEKLLEFTKNGGILPYAWNEVTLPQPFLIDKTELWFTVQFLHSATYPGIAFDTIPAEPFTNYLREPGDEWRDLHIGHLAIKMVAQGTPIPNACWCTTEGDYFGEVLGEKTATFDAKIDPTGLNTGDYSANLCIATNDNVNGPVFSIPVSLKIAGTFVKVDDIINVPTAANTGIPLPLTGTVVPDNATNQQITWSLVYAGTTFAEIVDGELYTAAPGTAVVKATIEDGWGEGIPFSKNFDIIVSNVGIETIDNDGITVSPNPTTGQLRIESNKGINPLAIEIFDIMGKKISPHHFITSSSHHFINITAFPAGVYFLKITTEIGVVTKKVIKN